MKVEEHFVSPRWQYVVSLFLTLLGADWYLSDRLATLTSESSRSWEDLKQVRVELNQLRDHCK